MRRTFALPVALAALLLLAMVGPVQAAPGPPQQVDIFGCQIFGQGNWSIPAGKDVYVRFGWSTNTWRQMRHFLKVATVTVKVDGKKILDQHARWGLPFQDSEGSWVVWWSAPIPKFAKGESRVITLQLGLSEPAFDGYVHWPAGKVFDPRLSCTVTTT